MMAAMLLLDAEQSEKWTAIGTMVLASFTFLGIFVQIYWNNKVLKDNRKNSQGQLDLIRTQLDSQNENAFKYSSVKIAQEFDEEFEELDEERTEAATTILSNKLLDQEPLDYAILTGQLDNIFDLFDTVGYFVRYKYIKAEVAHQYFQHWFAHYYRFFVLYNIRELADYGDTVWNNLVTLSRDLDAVEINLKGGRALPVIDKVALEKFFKEEKGPGRIT
jgi:hypothetical protein